LEVAAIRAYNDYMSAACREAQLLRFCLGGEYPLDTTKIRGGVPYVLYLLGETLAERRDIDLHLVTMAKGMDGIKIVERPGITIHYVGAPERKVIPNLLTQGRRMAPIFKELAPDVVNSHHYVTTDAAVRAGCRVVHTVHGIIHKEVRNARGKLKLARALHGWLEKGAVRRADAVIAVSKYAADSYAPWIRGPLSLVSNPIEDLFREIPALEPCSGILFAGAIYRGKNLLTLVRAMGEVIKAHPRAVLNVCGNVVDKRYMAEIEALIETSGLCEAVRFFGLVDRGRLAELLKESAALALPSNQESSPVVIAQAMAAGRVPVASPVGGIPEMLEDGVTGFLVPAMDWRTLADRLIALLGDIEMARRMGEAARQVAIARHDRRASAARVIEICSALAAGSTPETAKTPEDAPA